MRTVLVILSCACLSLIFPTGLAGGAGRGNPNPPDQPFDSYGDIPWEEEKAHLDNFAVALRQDPELVGYIIVYAGRRARVGEARDRAQRAKKYVVETRGIPEGRIKGLDGGHREEFTVILQPAPRDVQLKKDCGPELSRREKCRP
jgi:hypothetical protein